MLTISALVSLAVLAQPQAAPPKMALLIGIKEYDEKPINDLNGDKDVKIMRELLSATAGFAPSDITPLTPRVPKTKFISELDGFIGRATQNKETVVVIFYSGHGTQTKDEPNGDESDGLDEALVPSDAKYAGDVLDPKTLITDDEIATRIKRLRDAGVENVTLIFDCCHSGGGSRGEWIERAVENPQAPAIFPKSTEDAFKDDGKLGGYVVLSAARSTQRAYENSKGGRFTQALRAAVGRCSPDSTYLSLYERLVSEMFAVPGTNSQDPVIEGEVNRKLFTTETLTRKPYFLVSVEGSKVVLDAGIVHGIEEGTLVDVYPAETEDFDKTKPIVRATARNLQTGECDLELPSDQTPPVNVASLAGGRARVASPPIGSGQLRVYLEPSSTASLRARLGELKFVSTDCTLGDHDVSVLEREEQGRKYFVIAHPDGTEFQRVAAESRENSDPLGAALREVGKWRAIRELGRGSGGCDVRVDMEIVRVKVKQLPTGHLQFDGIQNEAASSTALDFTKNQYYAIRVRATWIANPPKLWDPCVAILNLLPTGRITQLWPQNRGFQSLQDDSRVIPDGQWRWLRNLYGTALPTDTRALEDILVLGSDPTHPNPAFRDPLGVQVFKLIATRTPEDYSGLLIGEDRSPRGESSPLAQILLDYAREGVTTRAQPFSSGNGNREWMAVDVSIRVVPPTE